MGSIYIYIFVTNSNTKKKSSYIYMKKNIIIYPVIIQKLTKFRIRVDWNNCEDLSHIAEEPAKLG